MKVTLPLLAIAGTAFGSFMERRDLTTVNDAFADITAKTTALGTAVTAYTQGGSAQPLIQATDTLLAAIKSQTTKVAATTPLTTDEALGVASGVTGLNATVNGVIDSLISKKAALVADGQAGTIYQGLVDQKAAADAFAAAVTAKTPDEIKPVADELSKGISLSLQRGIDAFAGSASPSPPGSSTGSAPAPPSSTPAPPPGSSSKPTPPPPASSSLSLPLPPPDSKPPKPTSVPAMPPTAPEKPCDNEPHAPPPPAGGYPAKPSHSKPAMPSKSAIPPPAQFTGAAAQVGTSMFALGVAAVALVM
jgi:hypothetical protein